MVKTQQLMRFEMYTIPAFGDKILGVFAIFCHLRSVVNLIFLTLVANYRNPATIEAPGPALRLEPIRAYWRGSEMRRWIEDQAIIMRSRE